MECASDQVNKEATAKINERCPDDEESKNESDAHDSEQAKQSDKFTRLNREQIILIEDNPRNSAHQLAWADAKTGSKVDGEI